ncbi:tetratricopeptide repeat protein [Leptolyngbya sp. AN02str]|uniref:tetratricopeptide repeat protein n=1 Tax=Leptolyngbya sp. AN02str TaxID=3423363 RepID=UPI003D3159AA
MNSSLIANLRAELAHWDGMIQSQGGPATAYVRRGMARFKLADVTGAIADFDQAEVLEPNLTPYLWQRGLAYYYTGQFAEGAAQFERDLQVNLHDIEETVWRYLCEARLTDGDAARRVLTPIATSVQSDGRRVMQLVYELCAQAATPGQVLEVGGQLGDRGQFYAHLYVGLYHEAFGRGDKAQQFVAIATQSFPQPEDYMWHLARVHCQLRGWPIA